MTSIDFPLILSGPIVRRADTKQITIWLATSSGCRITANFYKITMDNRYYNYDLLTIDTNHQAIRMGKNLFIHLVTVSPKVEDFPTDTLLGYNLYFRRGTDVQNLETIGLLSRNRPHSIVYGRLKYPAIFLNSSKGNNSLLYGSCRKPHGEGDDTLIFADKLIEKTYHLLTKRPSALLLLGDQIYADDVAGPLSQVITKLGRALIGQTEPLYQIDEKLAHTAFQSSLEKVNGRQYIIENFCHFTSSHADNHLMEFGEYAAMYLLTWAPQLWDVAHKHHLFQSFEELVKRNKIHFIFPPTEKYKKKYLKEYEQLKTRYNEQQKALHSFQDSLYRIRRLLANIPTYMIFDDHDITDDWNISLKWKEKVDKSKLGSHIIGNALSAYWAFQGWGNSPESFDSRFMWIMKTYFKHLSIGKAYYLRNGWLNTLLKFDSWHYIAPTTPKTVFLDTRTQREYDLEPRPVKIGSVIEETPWSPILINKNGWENVTRSLFESGWKSGSPIIIASAAPVYGLGLVESFLHDHIYPLRVLGINVQTMIDFEAWKYNGKGFTELLEQIAKWEPKPCIVVSGDVHYASAVTSKVTFQDGRKIDIRQFTSSPIKNMSLSGIWGLLMKLVIQINSSKRKKEKITRVCSPSFNIRQIKNQKEAGKFIWTDTLQYQPLEKESIIEIQNNIGHISITASTIQNQLLKLTKK